MKILHIVADHAEHSAGVRSVLEAMSAAMAARGHEVTIAFTGAPQPDADTHARIAFPRSFPKVIFHSTAMRKELPGLVADADVVHVHSNWTFPVWWGCRCAKKADKRLVHSPHGCLDPLKLKHSAWKKKFVTPLDRHAVGSADVILVASDLEKSWVASWNPKWTSRIQVLPFGLNPNDFQNMSPRMEDQSKIVLFLGRLHPLKGLNTLLEAWAQAGKVREDWKLVIAGPDEQGTRGKLEQLARDVGLEDKVRFPGPLSAVEVKLAYQHADFVVLPSKSESFGMVVLESLASGVPVLATQNTPWECLEAGGCGWWVRDDVEALAEGLRHAMHLSKEERRAMGEKGRDFVTKNFDWSRLAVLLENVYQTEHGHSCP